MFKMKCLCSVFSFICGIIELFNSILLTTNCMIVFLVLKQPIFAVSPNLVLFHHLPYVEILVINGILTPSQQHSVRVSLL